MLPCNTIRRRLQFADFCEEIVMSLSPLAMSYPLSLVHFAAAIGAPA
jgi:hypothetical protein